MKKQIIWSLLSTLTLSSIAFALPLAFNTASSIIQNGTPINVAADVIVSHDFPQFYIQKGKVFGSEYGLDPASPSCKANFTTNHQSGECKMSENEVFKMGPSVVKAGHYTVDCGNSDPSLRAVTFMIDLGSGQTLRLNCSRDSLPTARTHITNQDVRGAIESPAISFQ